MRTYFEAGLGILLAVLLQAILGKIAASLLFVFNVFSWVVLYFSLIKHEIFGAVMGTLCGLLQDSLSLGIFGVGGLTKTVLGFGAGYVARKINVVPIGRNFVFLFIMAAAELALWKLLVHFLFRERLALGGGFVLLQPLTAALFVTFIFQVRRKKREESS